MPVKSGLGASLGFKAESTYGTYVAPTAHTQFTSESLERSQEFYKNQGLQAGVFAQAQGLVTPTTRKSAGTVSLTPTSKGFGGILNTLHGNTVTPTGAGAAKTQVHNVGLTVPDGKSLSVQVGIPDTAGTVRVKTVTGAVTESLTLKCDVGGALEADWGIVGQDLDYTQTLATPTYATGYEVFGYAAATVSIGGTAQTVSNGLVKSVSATINVPRDSERFGLAGSATTAEPITNGQITLSGSMTMEFTDLSQINAFKAATWRALQIKALGLVDIQSGIKPELTLDVASFLVESATPVVGGPDVITLDINWTGAVSGSNPLCALTYVSTDTAV